MDVLTFGEALACFVPAEVGRLETVRTFAKGFGGSEANTAIGLARLGRSVTWVGVLGSDPFAREILTGLRGEGVDVSGVRLDPERSTALMIKEFRGGAAHVHYYRRGSAATGLNDGDLPTRELGDARRVHLTGITLALGDAPKQAMHHLLEQCKGEGIPVSFDPNLRRKLRGPDSSLEDWREVFPYVSDLLLSEREAQLCVPGASVEEALVELAQNGFTSVVITRGDRGAVGIQDGHLESVPAHAGVVVDSVGGGDAFNSGFLHERLRGAAFRECLDTGVWAASHVVAQRGDWEGLPTTDDYERWRQTTDPVLR